jgi:hypothetical protein
VVQLITGIIIGVLLAALISVGWAYYRRESNKFRNGKYGKEVTIGFIIVAAATAFFIPTLSLLTVESENTTSVNNFVNWHNGTMDVTIEYTNPLVIPLRYTMENLSNQVYVSVTGLENNTIYSLQLLSPENTINSHDGKFTPLENKTNSIKYIGKLTARHSDEISNSSYAYNLRIEYFDKGNNTLNHAVIPFQWTIISKDLSWLGYFWIVLAGIVASRFITFIIETGNLEKLDLNRTEALWLIYSFIIAILAFAGFKDQDILGESIFFNIMAAFAFGFGSQKVLELARQFPRSSNGGDTPPAQVTGLQVVPNAGPPSRMDITWIAYTEPDLHHYNIYRGNQPNFAVNLTTPDFTSQTHTYSDSPVVANNIYYYRIAVVNTSSTVGQLSIEVSAQAL